MSDYMKEAERLMRQYTTAVLEKNSEAIAFYHFTLLAHIQRGVPEGYVAVPRFLAENHRNLTDVPRYQRILDDCLAATPDQFRDATKMMAEPVRVETFDVGFLESLGAEVPAPAEVPMPEPDTHCYDEDERRDVWSHSADQMLAYGVACRAAGEAAGYARGLKEAAKIAEKYGRADESIPQQIAQEITARSGEVKP